MRASRCVVAALFSFAFLGTHDAMGQENHSFIKLAVITSNVRYCQSDSEVYTAQYSFIVEYRNLSDKSLRLVVGSEVPSELVAAANERDLTAGVLQLRMDLESYPAGEGTDTILGESLRAEKPTVVLPGQAIHSEVHVSLPVRNVSKNVPGTVDSGKHVLVIEVALRSTVPGSAQEGFRWVAVRSQPIQIDVPVKAHVQNCGN